MIRRAWKLLSLLARYGRDLLIANVTIARHTLNPGRAQGSVLAIPLETSRPTVIAAYANMVSLTPGTLTLDVAPDQGLLYVHVVSDGNEESIRRDLLALQRHMLEVLT